MFSLFISFGQNKKNRKKISVYDHHHQKPEPKIYIPVKNKEREKATNRKNYKENFWLKSSQVWHDDDHSCFFSGHSNFIYFKQNYKKKRNSHLSTRRKNIKLGTRLIRWQKTTNEQWSKQEKKEKKSKSTS